jgi:hypothetical protein
MKLMFATYIVHAVGLRQLRQERPKQLTQPVGLGFSQDNFRGVTRPKSSFEIVT